MFELELEMFTCNILPWMKNLMRANHQSLFLPIHTTSVVWLVRMRQKCALPQRIEKVLISAPHASNARRVNVPLIAKKQQRFMAVLKYWTGSVKISQILVTLLGTWFLLICRRRRRRQTGARQQDLVWPAPRHRGFEGQRRGVRQLRWRPLGSNHGGRFVIRHFVNDV